MQMRKLGHAGPEISVIGHGAWEAGGDMWGSAVEDRHVMDAMHAAIDGGVNWIDTAEAYGDGVSERLTGQVVRERRGEVLVFTKVADFASGVRPEDVRRAITGSLDRLGVEAVDLYQIHWPAEHVVPVEETWGAMAELVDEGLVRHIGVSNFDRALIERCLPIRHVDSVQNQYSLLHGQDRADLLPWLQERGIGYLAYGPLAFGILGGTYGPDTTFDESDWRSGGSWQLGYYRDLFAPGAFERSLERVERIRPIAERLGLSLPSLALAATVATPGVTGAIAGSRTVDHVAENARVGDVRLDEDVLAELEAAVGIRAE
jgi:aryl-alcohol dehydrogenase-like predicted oxidoreductase